MEKKKIKKNNDKFSKTYNTKEGKTKRKQPKQD